MTSTRYIGAIWGVSGFFFLLSYAIIKLLGMFIESLNHPWSLLQWVSLVMMVIFMAYSEGYKGFQKSYAPRFAARALYLSRMGRGIELFLAPLFCMNFFNAPKRRLIVSYCLCIGVTLLVILFSYIPHPWRGILDAGVVVGLTWGLISTGFFCIKSFLNADEGNGASDIIINAELHQAEQTSN